MNTKKNDVAVLLIVTVVVFIVCNLGWAMGRHPTTSSDHDKSSQTVQTANNQQSATAEQAKNVTYLFCPEAEKLYKRQLLWHAPGGWKSYTPSFVDRIVSFAGVQWIGVNVGKIVCLYVGSQKNAFPVSIERDNLVRNPATAHWGKDLGGYKICHGAKPSHCPFVAAVQASTSPQLPRNIYQGLGKR